MTRPLPDGEAIGLGRLCGDGARDWIRSGQPVRGLERIEARFAGEDYAPHRHDTYAIGITIEGVQTFRYRGVSWHSLPGQVVALHPDEIHDGGAGTPQGLRYRMLYLDPAILLDAGARGVGLPFVPGGVVADAYLRGIVMSMLADLDDEIEDIALDDRMVLLVDTLARHAGIERAQTGNIALEAIARCCAYLTEHHEAGIGSAELERVSGLDRFTLARQFRRALGTSPHRYLVMRRLDRTKRLIGEGQSLADAAIASGFVDQSHMNRHFKKAFGMTPGRWAALSRGATGAAA